MTAACKAEESKGRLSWCCAKNTGFAQPAAPVLLTSLVFFDWLQAFVWNLSPSKSDWLIIWWLILSRTKSIKIAPTWGFPWKSPILRPTNPAGKPQRSGQWQRCHLSTGGDLCTRQGWFQAKDLHLNGWPWGGYGSPRIPWWWSPITGSYGSKMMEHEWKW